MDRTLPREFDMTIAAMLEHRCEIRGVRKGRHAKECRQLVRRIQAFAAGDLHREWARIPGGRKVAAGRKREHLQTDDEAAGIESGKDGR